MEVDPSSEAVSSSPRVSRRRRRDKAAADLDRLCWLEVGTGLASQLWHDRCVAEKIKPESVEVLITYLSPASDIFFF